MKPEFFVSDNDNNNSCKILMLTHACMPVALRF